MISPLTKTPIRVIDDLTRPIYAPIVDENGMMSYDYLEVKIPQDEFDDRKILGSLANLCLKSLRNKETMWGMNSICTIKIQ